MQQGADSDPSLRMGRQVGTVSTLPLWPAQGCQDLLPAEGAPTHIWSLGFCGYHPGGTALDHVALVASRACACESYRSLANTERILNGLSTRVQHRGDRQKQMPHSLFLRQVYLHTLKTAI